LAAAELRVICGPTAAGKSTLAMALAERYDAMILSADSRQIYRGFDIGTAKPSDAERALVPHRGVDVAEPAERYSAATWAASARQWIQESAGQGRVPVVVGGTGFYIRALTAPLFEEPPLDPDRRAALAAVLAGLGTPELRRWCQRLDAPRAHLGRVQLLRAIEVALLTGVPVSEWHRRAPGPGGIAARYLVVDPGSALRPRLEARVHAMFAAGWAEEVAGLAARISEQAPAWNATGYSAVREYVRGRVTRAAAIQQITIQTRQYAKRQRTWFRHQVPDGSVTVLDPTAADAVRCAERWWNAVHEDMG
jgi:tRNA dimethylallyltransferase